ETIPLPSLNLPAIFQDAGAYVLQTGKSVVQEVSENIPFMEQMESRLPTAPDAAAPQASLASPGGSAKGAMLLPPRPAGDGWLSAYPVQESGPVAEVLPQPRPVE